MRVAVVICTRNRAESLRPTLVSIGNTTIPSGWTIQLLVVDNGSTDHTCAVIREVRMTNTIDLRYVLEPKPGQCHARNTGLRETSGDIILFTDDDIRVPNNWIIAMCQPFLDETVDAVQGGVIFPVHYGPAFERSPLCSYRSWFASTEELDPVRPSRLVGANMAFRRRVLEKVPGFDIELGPGALGFFDETLFSWQLLATGHKLLGALDVTVEHHFDLSRLTSDGLLDLARKFGRSHAFVFHHWEHQRSRLLLPRLLLCHLQRYWLRLLDQGKATMVTGRQLRLEKDLAFYREYLVQRRRKPKYPTQSHPSVMRENEE